MPELPEVEVTRRILEPLLVGRRIRELVVSKPSYFFLTPPRVLRRALAGRTLLALQRHGKYLLADADDAQQLLLHLGMTGQLFASTAHSPRLLSSTAKSSLAPEEQTHFRPDAHTHLCFHFEDEGPSVFFRDVRKFGKVRLLAAGESDPRLTKLGPDALAIDAATLARAGARRKGPVKSLLLDQGVLAGVGNIYADEALSLAGVRPTRPAHRVKRAEWELLAQGIRQVLSRSIETGGSSISDYVRPDGRDGGYQDERRVYGREGEACGRCGAVIRRLVIAARSSCFCPRCQR
jgi:formamidopyrimidine-DNA glycosylase